METAISVENLSVVYNGIPALWDISIKFSAGELTAIVGPNGAGKSTLIKAILGLLKPVAGETKILGYSIAKLPKRYEKIAYIPQRGSVDWDFPTNVLDVVLMGRYGHLGWFRRPTNKDKELALVALKKFEMEDYTDRQIGELSGGQQQRVFLARAIIQDAQIYLMDEPFGGVDAKSEKMTLDLLEEFREQGKTIIVVTHDLQSLKEYFDNVILINTQLIASGKTEQVLSEENLVLAYGGHMHMIYSE